MNKFLTSPIFNYISLYIAGAIATLSLPPFSILPFVIGFGFGLYRINFQSSLIKIFLSAWFLGFGWFSFGLYWIGSAFFMAGSPSDLIAPFVSHVVTNAFHQVLIQQFIRSSFLWHDRRAHCSCIQVCDAYSSYAWCWKEITH